MNRNDLHDYQKACVEHIEKTTHCGVFLEMGLGKTVSTLTAIEELMYDSMEVSSVLVVAPKRVAESVWQEEAEKWDHLKHLTFSKIIGTAKQRIDAFKAKADIHIISRDNLAWLVGMCGGGNLPFDMLVVDELSSFKSHQSNRFKCLKFCHFKRFVGLTGTPAPNGLIDLWPQIYLMDGGQRLGKTITAYRSAFFRPGRTNGSVVYDYKLLDNSEQAIHEKISDICISMSAKDYLTMPERTDNFIKLQMPSELASRYKEFEKEKVLELYGGGTEISVANAAALSNKLLQFANGAIYDTDGEVHEIHRLKLDALKDIVDDAQGKPVLVAWTFKHDRDRIMKYLKAYGPKELKGNAEIKAWNEGEIRVLLAHPASAGHGLNLQAGGNIIVWFGQTWSLELYQQFNARLYRQGQKSAVIIHHLIVGHTHDEDVIEALKLKDITQASLMKSIKAKIKEYLTS